MCFGHWEIFQESWWMQNFITKFRRPICFKMSKQSVRKYLFQTLTNLPIEQQKFLIQTWIWKQSNWWKNIWFDHWVVHQGSWSTKYSTSFYYSHLNAKFCVIFQNNRSTTFAVFLPSTHTYSKLNYTYNTIMCSEKL